MDTPERVPGTRLGSHVYHKQFLRVKFTMNRHAGLKVEPIKEFITCRRKVTVSSKSIRILGSNFCYFSE